MNERTESNARKESAPLHCVVGSGPAGVACAHALLERGATVLLLDAGIGLEPARADLVAQMRTSPPSGWTSQQIGRLKEGTEVSPKGLPLKLVYGSDFPYRDGGLFAPASYAGLDLRPSLARGGLSNVWGAAMLPYRQADLAGWPIDVSLLAPHYEAVLKLTGLSARKDDLEALFPLYYDQPGPADLSRQSSLLLRRLECRREPLRGAGIHFGQARLAMRAPQPSGQAGCVYCGMCMYGCPYGYIYNSAGTLEELRKQPRFTYRPDAVVARVAELGAAVQVEGLHRVTGEPFALKASRVYLAAGVIPSTAILLRSLNRYDQPVWLKDSQYFLFPLALARSAGDVTRESLHTLSQLFVEILDATISPHTVHLQVYSYNDLIGQAVRQSLGPLAGVLEGLARSLERRLLIIQGYLHSDHSARICATLKKAGDGADRLELRAETRSETRAVIGRVIRKLLRHAWQFGGAPVSPMLQVAKAGRGFHTGGAFPMSISPAPNETDTLGRVPGWQRVHAVDATVLPAIPATTITLSVMANAHRIGWDSATLP